MGKVEVAPVPRIAGVEPYAEGRGWVLYCGDSRELAPLLPPADVCLTSPPYLSQRTYGREPVRGIPAWLDLVAPLLVTLPLVSDGQMLINLGLVRRVPLPRYWDGLIDALHATGRQLVDWYVWDKMFPVPGEYKGRLQPQHEWVFHFRGQRARVAAKTARCKDAGLVKGMRRSSVRQSDGRLRGNWSHAGRPVAECKVAASVIRAAPCLSNTERAGHPAQMSVAAARAMLEQWVRPGDLVGDPFSGVATTGIAALALGARFIGIDIDPAHCATAAARLRAAEAALECGAQAQPGGAGGTGGADAPHS